MIIVVEVTVKVGHRTRHNKKRRSLSCSILGFAGGKALDGVCEHKEEDDYNGDTDREAPCEWYVSNHFFFFLSLNNNNTPCSYMCVYKARQIRNGANKKDQNMRETKKKGDWVGIWNCGGGRRWTSLRLSRSTYSSSKRKVLWLM